MLTSGNVQKALWRRWSREYVKALRERHNIIQQTKEMNIKVGEVVLVKSEERNRGKWKLGVVDTPIEGRDGVRASTAQICKVIY